MSKRLSKKLLYIIAVVAMLAMLIPMAIPVMAQAPTPVLTAQHVNANGDSHDIVGAIERFTVSGLGTGVTVLSFSVNATANGDPGATIVGSSLALPNPWVEVQAFGWGEAVVRAHLSDGTTITNFKKWGKIDATIIDVPQDVNVVWNEQSKMFEAETTVTDTVIGTFQIERVRTDGSHYLDIFHEPAQGAFLNWYLLQDNPTTQAWIAAHQGLERANALNTSAALLPRAIFAKFYQDGTYTTTTTGVDGESTVRVVADGEEPVLVLVIPAYPNWPSSELEVMIEWTKINFWTYEMEKVPQVRWAGEKIVLEKYFGLEHAGRLVRFSLENQSPGALEGLNGTQLGNLTSTQNTVWDVVDNEGWADVMVVSEAPGEVDIDLALYYQRIGPNSIAELIKPNDPAGPILNQHGFVVFYLKLEDITLGNVVGKRAGHTSGLWEPANPWDPSLDVTAATLNVSQDDLLRARVRGWFEGDNMSTRPVRIIDADPTNPGVFTYTLPAGRWVLPDDWPILAGPDWREQRIHWDIMDNPFDTVRSNSTTPPLVAAGTPASLWRPDWVGKDNAGMGPYYNGTTLVAAAPVIGPFSPGMELPTSAGYASALGPTDADGNYYARKTVVPNGALEWWDAPMPPAKITFKIMDESVTAGTANVDPRIVGLEIGNAGFFKEAWKADIYYLIIGGTKYYTNPFYWEMIPASPYIPAFVNNGGYDWNSWNMTQYGPYPFWKIINRPFNDGDPTEVPSTDRSNFPTKVQVYSDNHGEAMVYLNGNWNLNPALTTPKGADIATGTIVGSSTVVAMADYPYFRKHAKLVSETVVKTWTWGGMVLGGAESPDQMILTVGDYTVSPGTNGLFGTSNDKLVFVWATDRDHRQAGVLGMQVDWLISKNSGPGAVIPPITTLQGLLDPTDIHGVSNYNAIMKAIDITNGFLETTSGALTGSKDGTQGRSWMRAPLPNEKLLFLKFWGEGGINPMGDDDFDGVPGLNPDNFAVAAIDLLDTTQSSDVNVSITLTGPDKGILVYHVNVNFASAYPLDDDIVPGDANVDGKVNMADITTIERIILGLNPPNVNADANNSGKVNMGDVVKAERKILGLP